MSNADTLLRCVWRSDEYVDAMLRRVLLKEFSNEEITDLGAHGRQLTLHAFQLGDDGYDELSGHVVLLHGESIMESPVEVEWKIIKQFRGYEPELELDSVIGQQLHQSLAAGVTFVFSLSFQWGE